MPSVKQSQNDSQPPRGVLAGRTLRMMRKAHGINQRDLAALVGITTSHLSRVESGERPASPSLVNRICDVIATLPVEGEEAS